MSEEKKEVKECNCFCKSEGFRNFLITALGTFAGVYMALSLFTAIHKPPMPCPCHFMRPAFAHGQFKPHKDFKKFDRQFHIDFKGDIKEGKVNTPENND